MKRYSWRGGAAAALLAVVVAACAGGVEPGSAVPGRGGSDPLGAENLERLLRAFAHDTMLGRQPGTEGERKATAFLAAEVAKLGLVPAGEAGSYFQDVPLVRRYVDEEATTLRIGGEALEFGADYLPALGFEPVRDFDGVSAIFGGAPGVDSRRLQVEDVAGRAVVMRLQQAGGPITNAIRLAARGALAEAAVLVVVGGDEIPAVAVDALRRGTRPRLPAAELPEEPTTILVTRAVAERIFGASLDALEVGQVGGTVGGRVVYRDTGVSARNVIAVLPGNDPELRGQYVALGAHSDHVGTRRPLDHDSLRAYNTELEALRARLGRRPTAEERASIRVNVDSLRAIRPARMDSVFNGADDDGSGSVSLLAIAQAMAAAETKPRRSILFVWHTAEELGLLGSRWFTDNPTVPRDSIVAHFNMDMVGRGAEGDIPGGGPTYLQLVGSRRLSTELGDLVEEVNAEMELPFDFDYSLDADGHPERIYCRSDHWNYARWGIPVVFFTTGLHKDYHQVTDEPDYIDYPHMARVARLVHDVALRVASLDHRVVIDGRVPEPGEPCRQ